VCVGSREFHLEPEVGASRTRRKKMKDYQSLSHSKWNCKYHLIFIPKCRKKKIYGVLRHHLGEIFHGLAKQKEATIEEGHLHSDHVHMCISIPPKYAVANVVGFLKGKSAISIARNLGRKRNFTGESFWARGYFVSTVGLDEETVREYIRNQEEEEERLDQMKFDWSKKEDDE
jgi:putative transposase